jgi:hypothetical protein
MRAGYLGWLLNIVGVDLTAFLAIVARRVLVVGALAVPAVIGTLMLEGVPALVAIGVSGVALAVDALRAAQASEGAP